mmetsp:Transcript_826/g.1340  ORF Transcript_826/g.1340 Transcript_826/m.1340 type:complete len:97 (-) Transcript_826:239-529(-)
MDFTTAKLTKAERYGHPYQRRIHSSSVPLHALEDLLLSYLRHAMNGVKRRTGWSWKEMHDVNSTIDWATWRDGAVAASTAGLRGSGSPEPYDRQPC